MPRGNPIALDNGRVFKTQKEATEFYRSILYSSKKRINRNDAEYSDVMALYKRHPEFENKSKNEDNVLYFLIKESGEFGSQCFHAVHNDGSQTDWSFPKAISNKASTKFQCFTDGARHALELQTDRFRDSEFSKKCEKFLQERGYSIDDFPQDWVNKPMNSQYRATLLGPTKEEFVAWYKASCL